jgi:hypothetical protein
LTGARQHAHALAGSGDLGGARAVLEHAVDVGRANLGEDDPDVLSTALQLAQVHLAADDPSGARRVLEEAYAAGQWRLGDADPVMLLISHDLGLVAEELGNRHEARKAFARVAERGPEVLGADHWAVARARAYLGESPQTARIDLPTPPPPPAPVQEPPYRQAPPTTPFDAVQQPTYGTPAPPTDARQSTYGTPAPPTDARQPTYGTPAPPADTRQSAYGTPAPSPDTRQSGYDIPAPLTNAGQHLYDTTYGRSEQAAPSTPYDPPQEVGRGALTEQQPYTSGPPHPVQHIVSAPPSAPVRHEPERSAYARKAPALFAAIAAILAAVIAVVALIVVLAQRGDKGDTSDVPTLGGGPAPTDVRLRDNGASVQVSWSDPANGTTSFIISGGHPGEVLKPMGQVSPGQTSFKLNGLNADLDYCFAVVAVYSTKDFSSSPQACTSRVKGSPRPSTTQ